MNGEQLDRRWRWQRVRENGMGIFLLCGLIINYPLLYGIGHLWDRQVPLVAMIFWLLLLCAPVVIYIKRAVKKGRIIVVFSLATFLLSLFFGSLQYVYG
ncbi:hypothetical protein LC065_12775 [Halobacillus litoralis]|uniref:hypothetical protein n=1 Tax=Halobacillus litoralis TaxID=45668 RepID=UPI001CFCDF8F|nr:hypothetical protein [Halobacillus litoralis]WLR46450.1 hypothetical protein LC065_12775 [Halobacillus litoralis]